MLSDVHFVSQVSISVSVSESLFAVAEAEECLFLERLQELFIDLCQSTKPGAVAAATAPSSLLLTTPVSVSLHLYLIHLLFMIIC